MRLSKNKGDQKGRKTLPDKGKTGKSLRRKATGPDNPTGIDGSQLPKKVTYRQDTENDVLVQVKLQFGMNAVFLRLNGRIRKEGQDKKHPHRLRT